MQLGIRFQQEVWQGCASLGGKCRCVQINYRIGVIDLETARTVDFDSLPLELGSHPNWHGWLPLALKSRTLAVFSEQVLASQYFQTLSGHDVPRMNLVVQILCLGEVLLEQRVVQVFFQRCVIDVENVHYLVKLAKSRADLANANVQFVGAGTDGGAPSVILLKVLLQPTKLELIFYKLDRDLDQKSVVRQSAQPLDECRCDLFIVALFEMCVVVEHLVVEEKLQLLGVNFLFLTIQCLLFFVLLDNLLHHCHVMGILYSFLRTEIFEVHFRNLLD